MEIFRNSDYGRIELSLGWIENCALSGEENINDAGTVANGETAAIFKITVV